MDSDDEYERRPRGRDKFRRERSDYNDRSGRRDERSSRRDDWSDNRRRPNWDSRRKDYRDFDRDRRDSGGRHHDISPPMKRTRRDWDNMGYQGDYSGYNPMANQWVSPMEMQQGVQQQQYDNSQQPEQPSAPVMMTFKQFLSSMEDDIDDMEAVRKYQVYKVEFRKTQIADFFTTHKDEEWFRKKYHPVERVFHQKNVNTAVRKRAAVFLNLLRSGWLERFSLTVGYGEEIAKLLDAAVIKFEGGTDFDLKVLSDSEEPQTKTETAAEQLSHQPTNGNEDPQKEISEVKDTAPVSPSSVPLPETPAPPSASIKGTGYNVETIKPLELSDPSPEQQKLREEAEKYHQQQLQQQKQEEQKQEQQTTVSQEEGQKPKLKRKRRHREPYYYDENGDSESESESEVESEPAPPGEEIAPTDAQERVAEEKLLPPGVDIEPISSDEAVVGKQGGVAKADLKPPGCEESVESVKPEQDESGSGDKQPDVNETPAKSEETREVTGEEEKTTVSSERDEKMITEQQGPGDAEAEKAPLAESENKQKSENEANLETTESKPEETGSQTSNVKTEEEPESQMETSENADVATTAEPSNQDENDGAKQEQTEKIKTPRALHRTVSLFVRNVPPKISHDDIASVCARFPGYMRVVLSDPSPERNFSSRGWITFKPEVNIKDICWTMNNIKIKEIELNPIVNRELARRVRMVSGAAVLKDIVKTDITMAKKLIQRLDEKFQVWVESVEEPLPKVEAEKKVEEGEPKEGKDEAAETNNEKKAEESAEGVAAPPVAAAAETTSAPKEQPEMQEKLPKSNPILALLPDEGADEVPKAKEEATAKTGDEEGQITEEGQVEEDGEVAPAEQIPIHPQPVVDEDLVNLLDRLLLYLRIVHSLDYYSGAEYLYEDDMPNRCGIIHIRNSLPDKINFAEVTEWHKNLHQKLDQHLQKKEQLQDEEANQLGKKDKEEEVEKFVQANTQELAKDKWLCPLSGKKFRGPEFVKKHIFNKHADKVEGVKTEVTFFNNFVYDPKRPIEPEVKPTTQTTPGNQQFSGGFSQPMGAMQGNMGWGRGGGMMQQGGRGGFGSSHMSSNYRSGPDHYNRGQSYQPKPRRGAVRRDPRPIVQYKDLDAPGEDFEFF